MILTLSRTLLVLAVLLVSGTLVASAQTTTSSTLPVASDAATTSPAAPAARPAADTARDRTATNPNLRSGLSEQKQQRIRNLATNIANRVDAATSRLSQIADRLERRIDKSAAEGVDTTTATQALTNARALLTSSTQTAASLDQRIFATVTSENPRQDWQTLRQTISTLKADLLAARDELIISTRSLQSALNPPTPATSIPEAAS